jgi:hypothetical protein
MALLLKSTQTSGRVKAEDPVQALAGREHVITLQNFLAMCSCLRVFFEA